MDDGLRWRAWAASIAVHVAAGLLLAGAIESRHRRQHAVAVPPARRLVWVAPAPAGGAQEDRRRDPAAVGAPPAESAADAVPPAPPTVAESPVAAAAPPAVGSAVRPDRPAAASGSVARPAEPAAATPRSSRRSASTDSPSRRSAPDAGPHDAAARRAAHAAPASPVPLVPAETAAAARGGGRDDAATVAAARDGGRGDGDDSAGRAHGGGRGVAEAPVPLGAVARPPELLTRVMPEYPARARHLEIEGQVVLEIVVDREGRPEPEVRMVRSIALLNAAAVAAVRQWRFRPGRDAGGRPVRVMLQVPLRFELR